MAHHVIERSAQRAEQHDLISAARRHLSDGQLGVGLVFARRVFDDLDTGRARLGDHGGVEGVEIADQQLRPEVVTAQKGVAAIGGHDHVRRRVLSQVELLVFVLAVQEDGAGHGRDRRSAPRTRRRSRRAGTKAARW